MTLALLVSALLFQDPPKTGGPFSVTLVKPQSTYWCQVPNDYIPTRSWPLLLILHGAGDTAENFIKFWSSPGMKVGFILAAAKSRGQGWDDADGDIILGMLEDVKKKYRVDPDQVVLLGYSSGGFMATRWGFQHASHWRILTAIAGAQPGGGKEYKAAIGRMSVLVVCGDRDPNLGGCKEVFEKVKKDGFECAPNWVAGMEHSPLKPEAQQWIFDEIVKRLAAPAECAKRARKAATEKRYGDAIADWRRAADQKDDEKLAKAAAAELTKLEKAANDKLADGQKKLEKGDKAGAKKAFEEAAKYAGLDAATKAEEALKSMQ